AYTGRRRGRNGGCDRAQRLHHRHPHGRFRAVRRPRRHAYGRAAPVAEPQGAALDRLSARRPRPIAGYPPRLPLGLAARPAQGRMTRRNDLVAYAVAGTAIVAFAILLVFALFRLAGTEAEMRENEGDNMLWAISRAHVAALLLDAEITRKA